MKKKLTENYFGNWNKKKNRKIALIEKYRYLLLASMRTFRIDIDGYWQNR